MTRNAFNELVHTRYKKLYLIAFRIVKNQPEAEDAVQEVFLKMWKMGNGIDKYIDIEALAVTILKNKCIDIIRRRAHNDKVEDGSVLMNFELPVSPLDQMVKSETKEIVQEIISGLPSNFRDLVQMREIDGLSYEEIAGKTGANINSIRVSVSRARQIIKEKYLKYSYERGASERISGQIL